MRIASLLLFLYALVVQADIPTSTTVSNIVEDIATSHGGWGGGGTNSLTTNNVNGIIATNAAILAQGLLATNAAPLAGTNTFTGTNTFPGSKLFIDGTNVANFLSWLTNWASNMPTAAELNTASNLVLSAYNLGLGAWVTNYMNPRDPTEMGGIVYGSGDPHYTVLYGSGTRPMFGVQLKVLTNTTFNAITMPMWRGNQTNGNTHTPYLVLAFASVTNAGAGGTFNGLYAAPVTYPFGTVPVTIPLGQYVTVPSGMVLYAALDDVQWTSTDYILWNETAFGSYDSSTAPYRLQCFIKSTFSTNFTTGTFSYFTTYLSGSPELISIPQSQPAGAAFAGGAISLQLPTKLYACSSNEFNLWTASDSVLWADFPDRYHVSFVSSLGTNLSDCWRYTPSDTDVGTNTVTAYVTSYGSNFLTVPMSFIVTSNLSGASITRQVLVIGDSTTADGVETGSLLSLLSTNVFHVTLLGTVNSGGGTNLNEGYAGKTYAWHNTDAASPFVFSGVFNFTNYLTAHSWAMASNDWVIFNLGINDPFSAAADTNAFVATVAAWTNCVNMVTNIQSIVPGIRIGLCTTIPPSPSQDGFGTMYFSTAAGQRDHYLRNRSIFNSYFLTNYATLGSKVWIIPLSASINPVYGFDTVSVPESALITNLVSRYNNSVHPNTLGYTMVGDAYFKFLKGHEQ